MRLRHQGAILLGIPLVCQVLFALILVRNMALLEEAGQREANAKAVISACQDMKSVISRLVVTVAAKEFLSAVGDKDLKHSVDDVVNAKFRTINALLKNDPESQKVATQYRDDLIYLGGVVADFGAIASGNPNLNGIRQLARYLDNGEQMDEVLVYSQRCLKDDEVLMSKYVPMLEEWQPKALKERENLRSSVWIAIALETVLSLAIALSLGKNLVNRGKMLMSNIDSFSKGTTDLLTVGGNDELAELDEKFRAMAVARYEAEQFKRELMVMVAHDLRSPLASSNLIIDTVLARKEYLNEWLNTRLCRLQGELNRLLRLANSLLDIERIESNKLVLKLAPTTAADIACVTFNAMQAAATLAAIELVSKVETDVELLVDEDRIVEVLVNLVSNSLKFSPKNSNVTLRIASATTDGNVLFEVYDQGPGVPEHERAGLFKKFSQATQDAKVKKQGTGFGLYLTDMIVKAHGGFAGYRYSEDEGSCFYR